MFFFLGNLIQVTESRKFKTFGLKPAECRKESVRQCFLFSGYLLLTTRSSSGRLHLSKVIRLTHRPHLKPIRAYSLPQPLQSILNFS